MEKIAIYPGTFDPITNGHIDVIDRASKMFDKVIVVIAINSKKACLFSETERFDMAKESLKHIENVTVELHQGLTVDYARKVNATSIVRGIRAVSDFEYEFQIALMNRKLNPEVNTIFLLPHEKYTYLNSSIIRELSRYNEDVSEFVPDVVANMLKEKHWKKVQE
jgi:pantetheine-phosphate adenylyltransferase